MHLLCDPAIPPLSIDPREIREHQNACPRMLMAALFVMPKHCRQPTCPSIGSEINIQRVIRSRHLDESQMHFPE